MSVVRSKKDFKIQLSEDQKKDLSFHQDEFAAYGFANELQRSRMNLLLSPDTVQLLEYYRFASTLRVVVLEDHKPIRYTIDSRGNYLTYQIPTA